MTNQERTDLARDDNRQDSKSTLPEGNRISEVFKKVEAAGRRVSRGRLVVATLLAGILFSLWGLFLGGQVRAQEVMGVSMAPTLESGDRLLVRSFGDLRIERGSIVVMESPDQQNSEIVKRVVGLPGDLVEVRFGQLYVNDQEVATPSGFGYPTYVQFPLMRVPPEYYFVLGDNRPLSFDSQEFGPVHVSLIHGTAMFRYYPFARLGKVE